MLAVYPRMASHPPSGIFPSNGPNLLRQPSAEDIDAAHQLISSARGEHMGTQTGLETRRPHTPPQIQSQNVAALPEESIEQTSLQVSEEAQQLGQVCR